MYNYRDKSNKYIGKLNIFMGGLPITLRKNFIQLIILDIEEIISEYAKKFNLYTREEQQFILNNIYDNIDSTDDTIRDTIDEIDKYLPSFLLIWGEYYEKFPYYNDIDNIPKWTLPQRNPLKENVLLKLILENLKNKENLKKIDSEELLYPTYPFYKNPIIIKSPDSDEIIPISYFCKWWYSNIKECHYKKCPKIHFPNPFSRNVKCRNDPNCRNYENNRCVKFHTDQEQSLVFKKGLEPTERNLIGIKKHGLKKLQFAPVVSNGINTPKEYINLKDGRIIFPDDTNSIPSALSDTLPDALHDTLPDTLPDALHDALPDALHDTLPNANERRNLTLSNLIDIELNTIPKTKKPDNSKESDQEKKSIEDQFEKKPKNINLLVLPPGEQISESNNMKKSNPIKIKQRSQKEISDDELIKKKNEFIVNKKKIDIIIKNNQNYIDSFNQITNLYYKNYKTIMKDLEKKKRIYDDLNEENKENIDLIRKDLILIIKEYKSFIDKINESNSMIISKNIDINNSYDKLNNDELNNDNLKKSIDNFIKSQIKYINYIENIKINIKYFTDTYNKLQDKYNSIYQKYVIELNPDNNLDN